MKTALKIIWLVILTFTVMLLIYPLLHELGHLATAVIVGADLKEIGLFPFAYVRVDAADCTQIQSVWMLCAGSAFPLICAVPVFKNYYLYYVGITISLITLTSSFMSFAAIIRYPDISAELYDDYISLLQHYPGMKAAAAVILSLQILIAALYLALSHPLGRTVNFFLKNAAAQPRTVQDNI